MNLYEALWQENRSYNTDSSLFYATALSQLAQQAGNEEQKQNALLHRATALMTIGMFKEADEIIKPLREGGVLPGQRSQFFHLCRSLFGLMADYAVTAQEKAAYASLTDDFRDSLLTIYEAGSNMYRMIYADKLTAHGKYAEALRELLPFTPTGDGRFDAGYHYTIAEAYYHMGRIEEARHYYTLAAISDMQSDTREYIALRKLAVILFQSGDIDRAYDYLTLCMADAKACNARLRILEILDTFPVVNEAYLEKKQQQQRVITGVLIAISLLVVSLIFAIFSVLKQKKALQQAQTDLAHANSQLNEVNRTLVEYNEEMKRQNQLITETSYLKEAYITQYMDQCSTYLEKMESFRKRCVSSSALARRRRSSRPSPRIIRRSRRSWQSSTTASTRPSSTSSRPSSRTSMRSSERTSRYSSSQGRSSIPSCVSSRSSASASPTAPRSHTSCATR